MERFKLDKKNYEFERGKTEFDLKLCTNDDCTIDIMYKNLLKMETKGNVKDCMIIGVKKLVEELVERAKLTALI